MALKVFVADDSPTVQKKASGFLTGEGLEVVTVSNGVAAVKKLPTVKPALILADVAMPGKDGYEVCEFVKNSSDLAQVPVLLLFSDDDIYDEQKGVQVRADGRVKKPFTRDELIAAIARFVGQGASAQPPPLPKPATPAPPPSATVVTEPVDEEPRSQAKPKIDVSALGGGAPFGAEAPGETRSSLPAAPPPVEEEPLVHVMPDDPPAVAAEPVLLEENSGPPDEPPPTSARTMLFRAPADIAEPVVREERPPEPPPPPSVPPERTMMFHAPADIAEPVLSDEPGTVDSTSSEPPVSATTLESFSLKDATRGQVKFADAAAGEAASRRPATDRPQGMRGIDPDLLFEIVRNVVIKMSPPALSSQIIEDMAKRFLDEILADLKPRK